MSNFKATLIDETRHAYRLNEGILSLLKDAETDRDEISQEKSELPTRKSYPAVSVTVTQFLSLVLLVGGLHVMIRMGGVASSLNLSVWMQMQKWISTLGLNI